MTISIVVSPEEIANLSKKWQSSGQRVAFVPTMGAVVNRLTCLNGNCSGGENHFYCSQECKNSCDVFNKKAKDYLILDKTKDLNLPYTDEELRIWSREVLFRHSYECEICGAKENLHAHHIEPKKINSVYALDPDNGMVLCQKCHYQYGHKDECSTGVLSNKQCK